MEKKKRKGLDREGEKERKREIRLEMYCWIRCFSMIVQTEESKKDLPLSNKGLSEHV